jgi:mutator protein MutT
MYTRRVTLFILMDSDGKIVLQHRDGNAPTKKNMWAFFGGGIDKGETPEQTVRREAREELGIELKNLKFFNRYEFQESYGFIEKSVFVAELDNSVEELKKQQEEGDGLGLFSFEETKGLEMSENDMKILKDLFDST